jgi:hypothetical protein
MDNDEDKPCLRRDEELVNKQNVYWIEGSVLMIDVSNTKNTGIDRFDLNFTSSHQLELRCKFLKLEFVRRNEGSYHAQMIEAHLL